MSRIGKLPIPLPPGVKVSLENGTLKVVGPKGNLEHVLRPGMTLEIAPERIVVKRADDHLKTRSLHGLTRSIINNMVVGVTRGFEKTLEITGVGYRSEAEGGKVVLNVGYSHPITFVLPEGITAKVDKQNKISIEGCDKEKVGETAAKVRAFKAPEPYKGKGIKYSEEKIRRKVGKSGGK